MKLSAILLARYFAFIEVADLNPRGHAHFPELAQALIEKYRFSQFPTKPEDFDEEKGVSFKDGRDGLITIAQLQIFNHAIYIDTSTSTKDSERIFHQTLEWLGKEFGLSYHPKIVERHVYVSSITFHSPKLLESLNPALSDLARKLSARVPQYLGHRLDYSVLNLAIGYDPQMIKTGPSNFTIERRADTIFSEDKYFSNAPLPTEEHIEAIQYLESGLQIK